VEAAIDDVSIETFTPNPAGAASGGLAVRTQLEQNQPNPFNPVTAISFVLSNPAHANLVIYDAAGRAVRSLVDRNMTSGAHQVVWDGRDDAGRPVGSGTYFYRLKAGAFEQSRRMTILK
jgi:flagellar hook assembly protein FlgD